MLFVIGLDDKTGTVKSAAPMELTAWWAQLQTRFNGLAPNMEDFTVPYGDEGVVLAALLFETTAAPFVVKESDGKPYNLVVPWRAATGTRAATREDLLRILVPASRAPTGTALRGYLSFPPPAAGRPFRHAWLDLSLYITTRSREPVTFPHHLIGGRVHWPNGTASAVRCERFHTPSMTITNSQTELVVEKSGSVRMVGYAQVPDEFRASPVEIDVLLETSDGDRVHVGSREIVEAKEPTSPYRTIYQFETKRSE